MSKTPAHSSHGPSSWGRWVRCPASIRACEGIADSAGVEAREGTCFHHYVATALEYDYPIEYFLNATVWVDGYLQTFTDEMVKFAKDGIEFIKSVREREGYQTWIETRVDISPYTLPGQFGTADCVMASLDERKIIVFDWKYGMEPVYASENYQLQGYALGAWNTLLKEKFNNNSDDIEVVCIIEQPRVKGAGGHWKTSMNRILEFGEYTRQKAAISTSDDAPFVPGEKQCRWCPVRDKCEARIDWIEELIGLNTTDPQNPYLKNISEITPERRSAIILAEKNIQQLIRDLKTSARNDCLQGNEVPFLKLVEGRKPARIWDKFNAHKAEEVCKQELGQKAYSDPQFLSPAQIEKKMGKEKYEILVERFVDFGQAKQNLVPDDDTRESYQPVIDLIDDISEGDSCV